MDDEKVLAVMDGVREYSEKYPVELVLGDYTNGRVAIKTLNEGGNNATWLDLEDVIVWLRHHPGFLPELAAA